MTRLTTEEILQKSLHGTGQDPIAIQNSLTEAVKNNPKIRVLRSHNTLFIYENIGNGSVQFVMETADNPRDLVTAIKEAAHAMKVAGFHSGRFNLENPRILKALDMAGLSYSLLSNHAVMVEF
jgi:hypothetical protein